MKKYSKILSNELEKCKEKSIIEKIIDIEKNNNNPSITKIQRKYKLNWDDASKIFYKLNSDKIII